jgi:cytoskeleton protein RodZ
MESFGSRARRERERRGITLQDISKSTKIRVHYLLAIEQEHLDQLPGGIIRRGFVRAYTRHIGFDDEHAVEALLAAYDVSKMQLVPITKPEPFAKRCRDRVMRLPLWILAPGVMALGFGLVDLGNELRQRYDFFRESSAGQVLSSNSASAPQNDEVKRKQSTEVSANESQPSAEQLTPKPQERVSSVLALPGSSRSDKFTISIKVREDAWMSIIADGRRLLSETLVAPTERLVEAHDQIVVRAGNIGAVDFSFNGKRLPAQGDYNEARTLAFDVNGLQARRANDPPRLAPPASIQPVPASVEQ